MAVLASETGDGMTLDAALTTGRNLDNGAGGSGTRAWADTGDYIKSNGSNGFMADIESGKALVSMGSSINAKARVAFPMTDGCNICVVGRKVDASAAVDDNCLLALLMGTTSLRIREYTVNTDHENLTISALSTGTQYWLELEVNGTLITARVLNSGLTARDTVSHTLASRPTGVYWGDGFFFCGTTAVLDTFVVEDVPAVVARRPVVVFM